MATKIEIRNYAEANGISRNEARQHFINLAKQRSKQTFLTPLKDGRKLMAFGAYYLGDTDEGMGVTFTTMSPAFTEEMLTDMYRHTIEDGNRLLKEYYNRGSLESDRNELLSQLQQAVAEYNLELHGTTIQPNLGVYKDYAYSMAAIGAFIKCATLIAVLVCLDVIKDDNQNGLHTMSANFNMQFA